MKETTAIDWSFGVGGLNEGWIQQRTGRAEEETLMTGCSVSSHSKDKWSHLHRLMSPLQAQAFENKCGVAGVT